MTKAAQSKTAEKAILREASIEQLVPKGLLCRLSPKETNFITDAVSAGYTFKALETAGGLRGIIKGYETTPAKLAANDWNPNKQKAIQQKATKESLMQFGQVADVVAHIDAGRLVIVDGEHRYNSLKAEDSVSITVLFGYSREELQKLTIILNEGGESDKIELAGLLASISETMESAELLVGLPYNESSLQELVDLHTVDWTRPAPNSSTDDDDPLGIGAAASSGSAIDSQSPDADLPPSDPNSLNQSLEGTERVQVEWKDLLVRLPADRCANVRESYLKIGKEIDLSPDASIAWGQVVNRLAAYYIQSTSGL